MSASESIGLGSKIVLNVCNTKDCCGCLWLNFSPRVPRSQSRRSTLASIHLDAKGHRKHIHQLYWLPNNLTLFLHSEDQPGPPCSGQKIRTQMSLSFFKAFGKGGSHVATCCQSLVDPYQYLSLNYRLPHTKNTVPTTRCILIKNLERLTRPQQLREKNISRYSAIKKLWASCGAQQCQKAQRLVSDSWWSLSVC